MLVGLLTIVLVVREARLNPGWAYWLGTPEAHDRLGLFVAQYLGCVYGLWALSIVIDWMVRG
jgi:hypothetical protein